MAHAVEAIEGANNTSMSDQERDDFRSGVNAVLGYLEGFWIGLTHGGSPDREPREARFHAA